MVAFVKRRLQIFVSSTYLDLKKERQAAVEAILTAGHIPAGMELFTSGDESQMEVIKQWIDESDIYLLILGGRYGAIESNSGKSYTHLEYEYAISQKKPIFACVINDAALNEKVKNEGMAVFEKDEPAKLKEFRTLVTGNVIKFWDDIKDIKIIVSEKIGHFDRDETLLGWVRPDRDLNISLLSEQIARLSKENEHLRSQLPRANTEPLIMGLTFEEMKISLNKSNILELFLMLSEKEVQYFLPKNADEKRDCIKLERLGLLERHKTSHEYLAVSEHAKYFLNKYNLQQE